MAKRLTLKEFRRKLRHFGVSEDPSRGKGSHTLFFKAFPGEGVFAYPVPTHTKDVHPCYVSGARRRFRLTPEFGVTDEAWDAA
ncbi:MAG: hypothetical protein HYS13_23055 [Planctomycetia bacterium]|nr:hypothetical protein [Planctomycetia bacterium]